MIEINVNTSPFVGLRPFDSSESEFFFGREEQTKRLLNKLHLTNFVAVVGSSGSGKSSLVKAGLIPALKAGFLSKGDCWHFCSFRPGDNPIYYLASSLTSTFNLPISATDLEKRIKEEGTDEIIEWVEERLSGQESSLLLLVDQFEEVFTHFKNTSDQSSLMYRFEFVKILLELLQRGLPIYVIITMRSDFIGNCNIFYGLPEALSNSQFLVPRLQGSELIRVIESPIKLFGCDLESRLTQKILNDLHDGEDQLPILEHALSRLWQVKNSENKITEEDYKSIGKLKDALSNHANAIYNSLIEKNKEFGPVIREMFKYLIDFDGEKKEGVRQPRKIQDIQNITGAAFSDILIIYKAFSAEGASFLYSPSGKELDESSIIDISHESLMREWDLFRKWKEEEEKDKAILVRLNDFAEEYKYKKRDALTGPELEHYSKWNQHLQFQRKGQREKVLFWAKRYKVNFVEINAYIEISKKKQRERKFAIRSLVFLLVAVSLGFLGYMVKTKIENFEQAKAYAEIEKNYLERTNVLRSQTDSLLLIQSTKANIELATESTAQAAYFNLSSENQKLQREILSLRSVLDENARSNQMNKKTDNSELLEMRMRIDRLNEEILIIKKNYASALSTIDSLRLVIASYQSPQQLQPKSKSFQP